MTDLLHSHDRRRLVNHLLDHAMVAKDKALFMRHLHMTDELKRTRQALAEAKRALHKAERELHGMNSPARLAVLVTFRLLGLSLRDIGLLVGRSPGRLSYLIRQVKRRALEPHFLRQYNLLAHPHNDPITKAILGKAGRIYWAEKEQDAPSGLPDAPRRPDHPGDDQR